MISFLLLVAGCGRCIGDSWVNKTSHRSSIIVTFVEKRERKRPWMNHKVLLHHARRPSQKEHFHFPNWCSAALKFLSSFPIFKYHILPLSRSLTHLSRCCAFWLGKLIHTVLISIFINIALSPSSWLPCPQSINTQRTRIIVNLSPYYMARVKSVLCVYLRGEIIFLLHHLLWLLAKLIVKEVTVEMEGVSRAMTLILEGWKLFYIYFYDSSTRERWVPKIATHIILCVSEKEHRASKKKLIGNSYLTLHGTSSTLAHEGAWEPKDFWLIDSPEKR